MSTAPTSSLGPFLGDYEGIVGLPDGFAFAYAKAIRSLRATASRQCSSPAGDAKHRQRSPTGRSVKIHRLGQASLICLEPTDTLSDTPWRVSSGLRRTEYLCDRRILNTQRTSATATVSPGTNLKTAGPPSPGVRIPLPPANTLSE